MRSVLQVSIKGEISEGNTSNHCIQVVLSIHLRECSQVLLELSNLVADLSWIASSADFEFDSF